MKEYIDKEALLVKLEQIAREPDYQHEGEDWLNGVIIAQEEVIDAPSADVVERKRGEWKGEGIGDCSCSLCGVYQSFYTGRTNFCPNCGADMREVEHDSEA